MTLDNYSLPQTLLQESILPVLLSTCQGYLSSVAVITLMKSWYGYPIMSWISIVSPQHVLQTRGEVVYAYPPLLQKPGSSRGHRMKRSLQQAVRRNRARHDGGNGGDGSDSGSESDDSQRDSAGSADDVDADDDEHESDASQQQQHGIDRVGLAQAFSIIDQPGDYCLWQKIRSVAI